MCLCTSPAHLSPQKMWDNIRNKADLPSSRGGFFLSVVHFCSRIIRILWADASHSNMHVHVWSLRGLQRAVLEGTSSGKDVYTRSVLCSWHRGYKQPTLWSPGSSPSLRGCLVRDFIATSHWDRCFLNLGESGKGKDLEIVINIQLFMCLTGTTLWIPSPSKFLSAGSILFSHQQKIFHATPQITVLVTAISHVVWHSSLALQVEPPNKHTRRTFSVRAFLEGLTCLYENITV